MRSFFTSLSGLFLMVLASVVYSAETPPGDSALGCQDYDVFVMRHLEKEKGDDKDPRLSQKGKASAQQLANLAVMASVSHGFHTPYKRARQTLEFFNIEKTVYQPRDTASLVSNIKQNFCGESVLVVGHSNTVPEIVTALGGRFGVTYAGKPLAKDPVITLDENDYGSIFRITVHNERLHQQLYRLNPQPKSKKLP